MKDYIQPKPLTKQAKIAIISPAGAVEESQLENTIQLIHNKGYQTVLGQHLYTRHQNGYNYAGTEKERLKDLNWALNDPEISAIWASRGGYGCQHLLQKIKLNHFKTQPKWYIGYSDNTVIQSFLLKKGFASIHGQTIKTSSFGVTDDSYNSIWNILEGNALSYQIPCSAYNQLGSANGKLVGGNLALVYALLGTNYSFNFKDSILFLEDIGENYYALDRMFMSLELAGVFRKIKGLIIGGMTNMGDEKSNPFYENSFDEFAYQLIHERTKKYQFPVLYQFPNGHIKDNRALIIGADITLNVTQSKGQVTFL